MLFNYIDIPSFSLILSQQTSQQVTTRYAHPRCHSNILCLDFFVKKRSDVIFKRQIAVHHCIENYPAWPNVHFSGIILLLIEHLRRRITWRSTSSFKFLVSAKKVTKSKICNFNDACRFHQYVLWLHVSMGNSDAVKILKSKHDLAENFLASIFWKFGCVAYLVKKVSSFDVLHNKE